MGSRGGRWESIGADSKCCIVSGQMLKEEVN